jgi:HK97 family phage prohead protease
MPRDVERRKLTLEQSELRADAGEDGRTRIRGYAAVFDQETTLRPGTREVVRSGAFSGTLDAGDEVKALFDHDTSWVLGSTAADTLRVWEDERGLAFEVDPARAGYDWTPSVRDRVLEPLRRRELGGASFGFRALEAPEKPLPGGGLLREIERAELFEVSVVAYPAYAATTAALRSWAELNPGAPGSGRELVAILRAGLTSPEVSAMISEAFVELRRSGAPSASPTPRRDLLERWLALLDD